MGCAQSCSSSRKSKRRRRHASTCPRQFSTKPHECDCIPSDSDGDGSPRVVSGLQPFKDKIDPDKAAERRERTLHRYNSLYSKDSHVVDVEDASDASSWIGSPVQRSAMNSPRNMSRSNTSGQLGSQQQTTSIQASDTQPPSTVVGVIGIRRGSVSHDFSHNDDGTLTSQSEDGTGTPNTFVPPTRLTMENLKINDGLADAIHENSDETTTTSSHTTPQLPPKPGRGIVFVQSTDDIMSMLLPGAVPGGDKKQVPVRPSYVAMHTPTPSRPQTPTEEDHAGGSADVSPCHTPKQRSPRHGSQDENNTSVVGHTQLSASNSFRSVTTKGILQRSGTQSHSQQPTSPATPANEDDEELPTFPMHSSLNTSWNHSTTSKSPRLLKDDTVAPLKHRDQMATKSFRRSATSSKYKMTSGGAHGPHSSPLVQDATEWW